MSGGRFFIRSFVWNSIAFFVPTFSLDAEDIRLTGMDSYRFLDLLRSI